MGSKIYEKAGQEVHDMLNSTMAEFHRELADHGIRIAVTLVLKFDAEDALVQCLKLRGTACVAYIRTIRIQQKVYLDYDAEIMIDACCWNSLTAENRKELLRHELTNLEICKRKNGRVKTDDLGRAKVRIKQSNCSSTNFNENAACHNTHSQFLIGHRYILVNPTASTSQVWNCTTFTNTPLQIVVTNISSYATTDTIQLPATTCTTES